MADLATPIATPGNSLARRLRAGEREAIPDLYREYGSRVYGVAYRVLGNRSQAEEAQQQTFVQAWKAAATFDPERDPGPLLFTIAKRAAIDIFRRESRRDHDDIDMFRTGELAPAEATDVSVSATTWEIRDVVDGLPEDERVVVRLQHFGGMTHTEIADELGIPLGTVKSRSARAHRRLAAALAHFREEAS